MHPLRFFAPLRLRADKKNKPPQRRKGAKSRKKIPDQSGAGLEFRLEFWLQVLEFSLQAAQVSAG
jgi:hypothetical protein